MISILSREPFTQATPVAPVPTSSDGVPSQVPCLVESLHTKMGTGFAGQVLRNEKMRPLIHIRFAILVRNPTLQIRDSKKRAGILGLDMGPALVL